MGVPLTIRRLITNQPSDLPVFHPVAIQLQLLLESIDFKMADVIDLVNEDQALAGQILKLANSTVYVGRVRSETIKEAVIRLGAQHVAHLAMAVSQSNMHVSDNPLINDCLLSLWLHSHACAVGCAWVAKKTGHPEHADRAYMSGLLHDIGKLYLLKAVERLNKMNVAMKAAEEAMMLELFDELHIEVGCQVMEHWNMPRVYCDVVGRHHVESFGGEDILLSIVRFVNKVCNSMELGPGPRLDVDIPALPENELLKLSDEQLAELGTLLKESQTQLPIEPEQRQGVRSFELVRRPFNLGWELLLLEDGLDVEKRTFPLGAAAYLEAESMAKAWAAP